MASGKIFDVFESINEGVGWATDLYVDNIADLNDEEKWDLKIFLADKDMLFTEDGAFYAEDGSWPHEKFLLSVEDLISNKYAQMTPKELLISKVWDHLDLNDDDPKNDEKNMKWLESLSDEELKEKLDA